ncbi:MAG: hypothetical protein ACI93R_003890 [Flavobacteriales bacterium]|jgi:hypothetical protein
MRWHTPFKPLKQFIGEPIVRTIAFIRSPSVNANDKHVLFDYIILLGLSFAVIKGLPVALPMAWEIDVAKSLNEIWFPLMLAINTLFTALIAGGVAFLALAYKERRIPIEVVYFIVRSHSVFNLLIVILFAGLMQRLIINGNPIKSVNTIETSILNVAALCIFTGFIWLWLIPLIKHFKNTAKKSVAYTAGLAVVTSILVATPAWTVGADYAVNTDGMCELLVSAQFKDKIANNANKECLIEQCIIAVKDSPAIEAKQSCPAA